VLFFFIKKLLLVPLEVPWDDFIFCGIFTEIPTEQEVDLAVYDTPRNSDLAVYLTLRNGDLAVYLTLQNGDSVVYLTQWN